MSKLEFFAATCPITFTEFCEARGFVVCFDQYTLEGYAEARTAYAKAMLNMVRR